MRSVHHAAHGAKQLPHSSPSTFVCFVLSVVSSSLLLAGCGYRLAGQGTATIPADTPRLGVVSNDPIGETLLPALREQLLQPGREVVLGSEGSETVLRIDPFREDFQAVAYDAAGLASQYRLHLSSRLILVRQGKQLWSSGLIAMQGDVYEVSDPVTTEAAREKLRQDLSRMWMREALARLNSGF